MSAIDDKYAQLGGGDGFLGAPVSDETPTPDGRGAFRHFQYGSIYWSPETGAHEVHGDIRALWAQLGWEQSHLGFPVTDETPAPDGVGRFSDFQGGSIYWTPQGGAYEVGKALGDPALWAFNVEIADDAALDANPVLSAGTSAASAVWQHVVAEQAQVSEAEGPVGAAPGSQDESVEVAPRPTLISPVSAEQAGLTTDNVEPAAATTDAGISPELAAQLVAEAKEAEDERGAGAAEFFSPAQYAAIYFGAPGLAHALNPGSVSQVKEDRPGDTTGGANDPGRGAGEAAAVADLLWPVSGRDRSAAGGTAGSFGRSTGEDVVARTLPTRAPREAVDQVDRRLRPPGVMDHDHSLSKVAIALSGGGARGDFQVGALRYLYERELGNKELGLPPRPDIIAGTSVGAINGTKLAEGFDDSLAQLENIWEGLRTNSDMYLPTLKLDELLGPLSNAARSAVMGASAFAALTGGVILSPLLIVSALAGIGVARAELLRVIESLSRTPSIYNLDPIKKIIDGHSPYWSATGPGLRGSSLAVGHDRDGRTVVVARGYDDGCYVCVRTSAADAPTPAFSPWVLLGRRIDSDPALLTDDAGFVAGVIARKPDDGRFHELRLRDDAAHRDGWDSSWIPHGFPMPEQYRGYEEGEFGVGGASVKWASAPTLGRGSNRVETFVFARGTDKLPYYRSFDRFDRRWDQFRVMRWPIPIVGGIAFGRSSDNWKFAFARRANRQIVFCPSEPGQDGWADWQAFGGEALGDITAATNGDGRLHVFVVGTDRAVWARSQGAARGNTWENWRRIGGTATSTVAAARGPNDTLTAFVRGLDYAVWHKSAESPAGGFAEGEAGWSSLGTPERTHFLTDPVAVRRPDGKLEVYAVGNDKAVYVNAQADRAGAVEFAGWHRLGGAVWTGIELRLAVVSIEAAELRHVDESGRFAEYPDERPVGVPGGVIASASIPAIFPPVKMNDKAWVDGGCRSITPIKAAIDAGARTVYAICCTSAKPKPDVSPDLLGTVEQALDNRLLQRTAPSWSEAGVIEIGVRAVTEMLTTSIQQSELTPANPWPVPVYVIQPSFDLHDPLTINPALIRIAHAYGWMRAYEATSLSRPAEAMRSSDEIIHVRRSIFEQEGSFNLLQLAATWTEYAPGFTGYPREGVDPHSEETLRNCDVAARYAISLLLDRVRVLKRELATLLDARRARRYELPPGSEGWSTRWEMPSLSAFFPHGPFARIEIRSRGGAVATAPATAP